MINDLLKAADPEQTIQALASDSPQLDQFRTLSDQGDFAAISQLCAELADQGIFDVRLLLSGLYEESKPDPLTSLPDVLDSILNLLGEYWFLVTPEEKKAKYAKGSLTWLLKQILVDLQTQEVGNTEILNGWLAGNVYRETIDAILKQIYQLSRLIDSDYEEMAGGTTQALNELSSWLKTLQPQLLQELANSEGEGDDADQSRSDEQGATVTGGTKPSASGVGGIQGSYHLNVLIEKMALLKQLSEEGNILKVAILAADINATIEEFDPKKYFPQLFSDYLYLMVNHANQINEALEMRDSPQWIVLNELLQTDPEKFKEIPIEF